ncbi:MAG: tandem-95 repeat protein, partial [Rhodospirillales bacterium]
NGVREALHQGDPVYKGDVVATGAGAKLGLVFVDKTTFALSENARMVLDDLVFNPSQPAAGASAFTLLQGAFVAVSGEIAKANPAALRVDTPVATLGVRGTEYGINVVQVGGQTTFALDSGVITVTNSAGSVVIDIPGWATFVSSPTAPPTVPGPVPQSLLGLLFQDARGMSTLLTPFSVNQPPQQQQQQQQNPDERHNEPSQAELQQAAQTEPAAGGNQPGGSAYGDPQVGSDSPFFAGALGLGGSGDPNLFNAFTLAYKFPGLVQLASLGLGGLGGVDRNTELLLQQQPPAPGGAPVAVADTLATAEDTALTFNAGALLGNDASVSGGALSIVSVSGASNGTVVANGDGTFTYTPNPDFNGVDNFAYTVADGLGGSATGTVVVTVTPVNDPPIAAGDALATAENKSVVFSGASLIANDSDPDGGTLSVVAVGQAAQGSVVANGNGTFTYTPNPGFSGVDSFTYTVTDNQGGVATASVTVTVGEVNDAPVVGGDVLNTFEDTAITFAASELLANDTDADGDALAIIGFGQPVNGTLADNGDGTFTYTPDPNFSGPDFFTYTVSDGKGGTASGGVTIAVGGANEAPTAGGDSATTPQGTPLLISSAVLLANDSDPDGGTLAIIATSQPANGSLVANGNGTFTYTPNPGFAGGDAFTYTLSDGQGGTATATVSITVTPVAPPNTPPVAVADAVTVIQDQSGEIFLDTLLANDLDADGDAVLFESFTDPAHGALSLTDGGFLSYVPDEGYSGPDSFTYTISDGKGGFATGVVNITVTPADEVIVGTPDPDVLVGGAGNDTLLGSDGDDTLIGGAGDDSILGEGGDDVIQWNDGDGNDTVAGDGGDDTLIVDGNPTGGTTYTLSGESIPPVLLIDGPNPAVITLDSVENITIVAGDGDDALFVDGAFGGGTVTFVGGGGNDTVAAAGSGLDYVVAGGAGDDVIFTGSGDDLVTWNAGDGSDLIDTGAGQDTVQVNASDGADLVSIKDVGGQTVVTLAGALGGEILISNAETLLISVTAGSGDDIVTIGDLSAGGAPQLLIDTGSGNDTFDASAATGPVTVFGGIGNDTLIGGAGDDVIDGGPGADVMAGGPGNDTYYVDDPGDTIVEEPNEGVDKVIGSASVTLSANVENLTLAGNQDIEGTGNELDNVIVGNDGDNVLAGGAGNDTLIGGLGADALIGGEGNDTYEVDDPGDTVVENADEGLDVVESSVDFTLPDNVEVLVLTGGQDIDGTGNGQENVIFGNNGANVLTGAGGNDNIFALGGDDTIVWQPGDGNDQVDGGAGTDTLLATLGSGGNVITLSDAGGGFASLAMNGETLLLSAVEIVKIDSGDGDDDLVSNTANVALDWNGGGGNDSVIAGAANDTLAGGSGNDFLQGGAGADALTGGPGADTYHWRSPGEAATVASNGGTAAGDVITDFTPGEDKISLFGDNFGLFQVPTQEGINFSIIDGPYDGTAAGGNANFDAGAPTLIYSKADSTLYFDANGKGEGYTIVATVDPGVVVTKDDVQIVITS